MRKLQPLETTLVNGGFANVVYDDPDFPPDEEPGQRYPQISRISRRIGLGSMTIDPPQEAVATAANAPVAGWFKKPARLL